MLLKLLPHFLSWAGIVLVLLRAFPARRPVCAALGSAGFAAGVAAVCFLLRAFPGDLAFGIFRGMMGGSLLLLWFVSVVAVYRSTTRDFAAPRGGGVTDGPAFAGACSIAAGVLAGAVCACRVSGGGPGSLPFLLLVPAAAALAFALLPLEARLPGSLTLSRTALVAPVVALLLFSSSSLLRLDLFAPLSMKVMKFAHDFVHQFMESMLFPDHFFIRSYLWGYIGLLFGEGVGFWGALVIWFTPVALVLLALQLERLPSVAHIRQGARRRKLLATALGERRRRLVIPLLSLAVFGGAAYQSRYPSVEYWDPKPLAVAATPAGEIVIPKKGDVDLQDGRLHKYLYKQGAKEARFFVLMGPSGHFTVDLDACAICKPDGYGQAEGTVICYYCKTLIPLETVGRAGGCNPVPINFTEKEDGIHLDALALINEWGNTVQTTTKVKEGGK